MDNRNILCVTNRSICEGDFLKRIEDIASCGVKAIILREKDLSAEEYRNLAEKFTEICKKHKIEAVLHTYTDVAIGLGVKSIHLPLPVFKDLSGEKKSFFEKTGVSCHSVEDALEAEKLGASYITFGHVFATDCKKGLEPRGLSALKKVCEAVKIPVYAIGGINCENIGLVFENGAGGACIMSGFMKCRDVAGFVGKLIGVK
ncbi:thiamine phosphate synthase [bacterium]|nr:thiamine phosphate synthase [bacterium]